MSRIIGNVVRRRAGMVTEREIRVEREGNGVVLTKQVREDIEQHEQLLAFDEQNAIRLAAAILVALDGEGER